MFTIVSGGYTSGLFKYGASTLNDLDTFTAGSHTYQIDYGYNTDDIILTEVPEPSALGLLTLAGLAAMRRRCGA